MQESQEIKWEVGQEVWCVACGRGTITRITTEEDTDYPIVVDFTNGDRDYYTIGGKLHTDGGRTLFFSEPKVEAELYPPFVLTFNREDIAVLVCRGTSLKIPVAVVVHEETETMLLADNGTAYNKKVHDIYRTEKI